MLVLHESMSLVHALAKAERADARGRCSRQSCIPPSLPESDLPSLNPSSCSKPEPGRLYCFFLSACNDFDSIWWMCVEATCTLARPLSDVVLFSAGFLAGRFELAAAIGPRMCGRCSTSGGTQCAERQSQRRRLRVSPQRPAPGAAFHW
jgi:hypothetical protein